jgi:hypothetical protein
MVKTFFMPSISYRAADTVSPRPRGPDILERYRWITRKERVHSCFGSPKNPQGCGYPKCRPAYPSELFEDSRKSPSFKNPITPLHDLYLPTNYYYTTGDICKVLKSTVLNIKPDTLMHRIKVSRVRRSRKEKKVHVDGNP